PVATTTSGADTTVTPDTTDPGDGTTETTSDRPLAPDFTLELGDGGSYTLSEGEKPVYLVFWAEW
ncbi:MAG TPA: TlpA family protein disulfide reductase, partial [Acidimicrobiia bacterium]|nr:TlpA family protein disulfide reductase [Acidimicrobiia bacterium]